MTASDAKMVALELLCARFSELLGAASAEIPQSALDRISELEGEVRAARAASELLRRELSAAMSEASIMRDLCAAAIRWRRDRFSPRLEQAIDTYSVAEVGRRV